VCQELDRAEQNFNACFTSGCPMVNHNVIAFPLHDHDVSRTTYLWNFIHNGTLRYNKNCICGRYNKGCVVNLVGHTDDEVVEGAEADDAGDAQSSLVDVR
jgi:hypothetical protein